MADHVLGISASFGGKVQKSIILIAAQAGKAGVFAHSHFQNDALLFAIFRRQGNAGLNGFDGVLGATVWPFISMAAESGCDPEQGLQHLRAPGSNEAGDADDFASV